MMLFDAISQSFTSAGMPLIEKHADKPVGKCGAIYLQQEIDCFISTIEVASIAAMPDHVRITLRSESTRKYSTSDPDLLEKIVKLVQEKYSELSSQSPFHHVYGAVHIPPVIISKGGNAFSMSGVTIDAKA